MRTPPVINPPTATRRQQAPAWLWLGAVAALAGLLAFLHPVSMLFLPSCPFHRLTGWYCPGCGMTRAVLALLHGEPMAALRLNPLLILLLPSLGLGALYCRWRGRPVPWSPAATWVLVTLILMFGIARNLPFEPFTTLAP